MYSEFAYQVTSARLMIYFGWMPNLGRWVPNIHLMPDHKNDSSMDLVRVIDVI